jgi:hypothetical protein
LPFGDLLPDNFDKPASAAARDRSRQNIGRRDVAIHRISHDLAWWLTRTSASEVAVSPCFLGDDAESS